MLQILQKNNALLEDRSQPLLARNFQCATTEAERFDLLACVLVGMKEVCIVIDIEILRDGFGDGQAWPAMFMGLFMKLMLQSPNTIVKVAIVFYLTKMAVEGPGAEIRSIVKLDNRNRREKAASNRSSILRVGNNNRRRI